MIPIHSEDLIPLREVPRHLARRPGGKPVHLSAVYRWAAQGVRGVKLEAVRVGGTSYTSRQALQRFAERMSLAEPATVKVQRPRIQTRNEQAARELRLGWLPGCTRTRPRD